MTGSVRRIGGAILCVLGAGYFLLGATVLFLPSPVKMSYSEMVEIGLSVVLLPAAMLFAMGVKLFGPGKKGLLKGVEAQEPGLIETYTVVQAGIRITRQPSIQRLHS